MFQGGMGMHMGGMMMPHMPGVLPFPRGMMGPRPMGAVPPPRPPPARPPPDAPPSSQATPPLSISQPSPEAAPAGPVGGPYLHHGCRMRAWYYFVLQQLML